jgi:aminoglycoside phosphotransferase (APT) family kinase protein
VVSGAPNAPTRAEMLDRYASLTGRAVDHHQHFYELFGLWRSIGIFEGIHARSGGTRFTDETPLLVARAKGMMAAAPDPR